MRIWKQNAINKVPLVLLVASLMHCLFTLQLQELLVIEAFYELHICHYAAFSETLMGRQFYFIDKYRIAAFAMRR